MDTNYKIEETLPGNYAVALSDKPNKLTPSLGLNALLEYHFGKFFVSSRAEVKMRTDWDITVFPVLWAWVLKFKTSGLHFLLRKGLPVKECSEIT